MPVALPVPMSETVGHSINDVPDAFATGSITSTTTSPQPRGTMMAATVVIGVCTVIGVAPVAVDVGLTRL